MTGIHDFHHPAFENEILADKLNLLINLDGAIGII